MAPPPAGARHANRARPSTTLRPLRSAPLAGCMFCLATGAPRSEEHLIPQALGGRLTLRDAVCEPCRRLTGRREQLTLDHEFVVPRTLLALKRRRARGKGPNRLPPVTLAGDAAPSTLTANTFPRGFALPAFEPAGLLTDTGRATTTPRVDFVACHLNLGAPTRHCVAAPPLLADPHDYAYSIAKWAYSLAVAERGVPCCDTRAIRDLILGKRHDAFAFVGTPSPRADASPEWLHDFALREIDGWLVVTLALFASAGMTPYEIVIGRLPRQPGPAPTSSRRAARI